MMIDREWITQDPITRFIEKFSGMMGVGRIVMWEEDGIREMFLLIPDREYAENIRYANAEQVGLITMIGLEGDRELLELTTRTRLFAESRFNETVRERGGEFAPGRKVRVVWKRPKETALA